MTNFVITKEKTTTDNTYNKFESFDLNNYTLLIEGNYLFFQNKTGQKIIIIGDCINSHIINCESFYSKDLILKLKGIFIAFIVEENKFLIIPSLFGFFPVYYSTDYKTISNSIEQIKNIEGKVVSLNKRFVLESYLFNYSFSNQTYLNGIYRLNSFSLISYHERISIERYSDLTDFFINNPTSGKNEIENLGSLFLTNIKEYFSESGNSITFTSGFDGRTILSSAIYHSVRFDTFSLGREENDDVAIPLRNSKDLNIPYHFYDLGCKQYAERYYLCAQKMSKITGGFNGFLYGHFLYGAEREKEVNDILHTGYCGSELFRALHIQGAVTSKELVSIFTVEDDLNLKDILWNSPKLAFIKKLEYRNEFEDIFTEILEFRKTKNNYISINHFFYSYVFTEVFRKVFGAWTLAQMQEMIVRTPFLDYDFVTALMKTDLAGCNNDFFTHNPLKRLKGQQLYAEIIRQSNSQLYKMKTGKGYRPIDLLTLQGKVRILFPYLKKRLVRQYIQPNLDNLGIISAYQCHKNEIDNLYKNLEGFEISRILDSSNKLNPYTSEEERDILLQTASLASIL
jgi:hypothetical protein